MSVFLARCEVLDLGWCAQKKAGKEGEASDSDVDQALSSDGEPDPEDCVNAEASILNSVSCSICVGLWHGILLNMIYISITSQYYCEMFSSNLPFAPPVTDPLHSLPYAVQQQARQVSRAVKE